MTKEEAMKKKTFKNCCTCGGYAYSMNGRNPRRPHMDYCPQKDEYNEWYDAFHSKEEK
jgi:hypothetical protein